MEAPVDPVLAIRREALRTYRSWASTVLGFVALLCGAFTLLTVMTGFFLVLVVLTAGVYAFTAWVVVRSYLPARDAVTYLVQLLDGLGGYIAAARSLDVKDEIPHGRAVIILSNDIVLHLDGPRLEFLRLLTASGEPFQPTMAEALAWVPDEPAPDRRGPAGAEGAAMAALPDLQRIARKWSLQGFELGFRSALAPAGRADDPRLDQVLGVGRRSASLTVRGTRVPPAEIVAEMDAVRDLLDSLWRTKARYPGVSPYA